MPDEHFEAPDPPLSRPDLLQELRLVRLRGLAGLRDLRLPTLYRCCQLADLIPAGAADFGRPAAVAELLRLAVDGLGGDRTGGAAAYTFGLAPGTKFWAAQERRRAAAKVHEISVERFRKGYEPKLLGYVADEILQLCASRREQARQARAAGPPGIDRPPDQLARSSSTLLTQLGRRRTAYPLDMSLDELVRSELFVEPHVSRYGAPAGSHHPEPITRIVQLLTAGRSCLVLGEPGAGKSLALYWIANECLRAELVPLALPARGAAEFFGSPEWDLISSGRPELERLAIFIDGIDEAVAAWERAGLPQGLLSQLARFPCLITSRTREFEQSAVLRQTDVAFDSAYVLQGWAVHKEFKEYLDRLARAGLLRRHTELYETVTRSGELARLVSRPLYARMLTFVGDGPAGSLSGPDSLYSQYTVKLALVADSTLSARGCELPGGALAAWKTIAWLAHEAGASGSAVMDVGTLTDRLAVDSTPECARAAIEQILDTRSVGDRELGEFIHYSFFEYLLASYVLDVLSRAESPDQVFEVLRYDLNREVRHFLVAQLRTSGRRHTAAVLADALSRIGAVERPDDERLSASNLLVYLLSRAFDGSVPVLERILATERDDFLRIAILWALCHLGSAPALEQFHGLLENSPTWRALCRGYVLYYYGDIPREHGPPYIDAPPYVPHLQTQERVLSMLARSDFRATVRPERRFIDVYTFLDILRVRATPVAEQVRPLLDTVVGELEEDGVATELVERLRSLATGS